ncbi:MAG: MFS transporter [Acidobacteria bacterium]|nr:MAG: MFS transporter [Acidobacteriota bacterium]PYY06666.1 MAG: MFS transporter [Acidobacteriota bacterium]
MNAAQRSRVRWLLVFWLFVLSTVAYLDRVNISVAGGSIANAYGFSNIQLGWVFSAFLVGYALFQTVGGYLADRFGPRRVLAAGVLWWGIFTAVTASIPAAVTGALWILIAVRFLLGAGEAVVYPASNQFVAQWIPQKERGIANGWIFAGVGVGAGFAPPLITYVMIRHGWRASFWVCALIGFAAGAVWYLLARDTPADHPRVSASELARIRAGLNFSGTSGALASPLNWAKVVSSKEVRGLALSYFCYGYVAWIFFSWFYIYLAQARQLNLKASAFYAMLPFIAMATGCLAGGAINDRLSRRYGLRVGRCILACVSMAVAGAFLALGAEASSARIASIVLAGGAGALYLSQSSFWSVTVDIAGKSSGSVSGFMNMGNQIGGAVTASLTPVIAKHFGWGASFLIAAALCAVGALAWLFVNPERGLPATPGRYDVPEPTVAVRSGK